MVNMSSTIGATELAWQQRSNSEYAAFQLTSGRQFSDNSAVQPYLAKAESDAASGETDRVVGDRDAQDAVNRHRAAVSRWRRTRTPRRRIVLQRPDTSRMKAARYSICASSPP
ncbi:unnamed protein product [Candidatus Paraburkholderia kirkii UZHbot1]|uniref:WGS project CAFE00000000 data, contig bkir_c151 n=1 Tax=Candidatus Paraburkholderia kirkii UZHbot1 TaxID=1055526 RepID=U3UAK1_9BURK|nr:unnamed protein product [Candidatus Paraburkholderia kirkii UZHbot1]